MQQSSSTIRTGSDNEESIAAPSTPPSPKTSPLQMRNQPQTTRSPKMGRRALHCGSKQGASSQTYNDLNYQIPQQSETVVPINEYDQFSVTSQNSGTCSKGLDRVLLERNIEKLLERNDKSSSHSMTHQNQQIHKLYQDRSREPLDLTDLALSLDNLSPKSKTSINPAVVNQYLSKDPSTTSSMPELPMYEISKLDEITPINEELPDVSNITSRRDEPSQPICKISQEFLKVTQLISCSSTVIPTTSKKEVRFEGDYQDTLPRSRSYSGKSSRSSGRRRKGTRQKKSAAENSQPSRHRPEHRKSSTRSSRHSCSTTGEPSTSHATTRVKADVVDGHHDDDDDTETTRSLCSTCSSSSSDSDDFNYELPQRQVYGGVRVNYVPNDALAFRKEQQQQQQHYKGDQSHNSDRDKNCTIS